MVGPLRAISFSVGRIKEDEEEYSPWHAFAEAELMVRTWTNIGRQLTSFLSPFLPLVRPRPLPARLLVLDLCSLQQEYVLAP